MTEQYTERRRGLRVVFRTTVRVMFAGGRRFADCETSDISTSGVFVKGVERVAGGEKCRIELRLTGKTSNLLLEMNGEVVRVQDDGVALEFFGVDEDSFYHLQNIVYFSYKHCDGPDDFLAELEDVADETLYYGLDAEGKAPPLPEDFLGGLDGNDDDFEEELSGHIIEQLKRRRDDDDY